MKKKALIATVLVAAMAVASPMSAFARRSSSTSSSVESTTTASQENNGHSTTTNDGQSLSSSGAGSKTENVSAVFAVGTAATAGLPESVVSSINSINSGSDLTAATGDQTLGGYAVLTQTAAVVLQDQTTGAVADQNTTVSLYVPNLIEGLQGIKVLYYENATGRWVTVDPVAIDFTNHIVTFNMYGSGTVTVLHYWNG